MKKNLKAKSELDSLFGGNTFAIRCRRYRALFGVSRMVDPVFGQILAAINLAIDQLIEKGEFSFPAPGEDALIPLDVSLDAKFPGWGRLKACDDKTNNDQSKEGKSSNQPNPSSGRTRF